MRKISAVLAAFIGLTTAAHAADLPAKAPPAPAIFNWSGCYFGAEGGGGWGRSEQVAASSVFAGSTITGGFDVKGGLAGATFGCNLQLGNVVLGIEDDYSWTNAHGSASDRPPFITTTTSETREKWINTLRGRVGYAFDRFLVYGTAGGALAGTEVLVSNAAFGTLVDRQSRSGWVAGLGGEWAAWSASWVDVTFKVEYLHADFGSAQYFNPPVTVGNRTIVTRDTRLSEDMVRAGVNLKLDWGGPAAPVASGK